MGNLTDNFVAEIDTPGRYTDGRDAYGLSLLVKAGKRGLRRTWTQRLKVDGKYKNLGLGAFPIVSLPDARAKAFDNAKAHQPVTIPTPAQAVSGSLDTEMLIAMLRTQGFNISQPMHETPTVSEVLEAVIDLKRAGWKDEGKVYYRTTEHQWRQCIHDHAETLLDTPIGMVDSKAIMDVLSPIWQLKRETATRVKDRLNELTRYAIANGYRQDNPVEAVKAALPKNKKKVTHMKALHHSDVARALETVRRSGITGVNKFAFEFLTLTGTRLTEVREAVWSEIDFDNHVWTIPAERMKAGREHRIPLSKQCMDLLWKASEEQHKSGWIFVSERTKTGIISINALAKMCERFGLSCTPHGMRSSFRDWAAESGYPREVAEMALGHIVGTAVELAYRRTDFYEQRQEMMQAWADYIKPEYQQILDV